jgi:hypothetical protein
MELNEISGRIIAAALKYILPSARRFGERVPDLLTS